uniref:Uncharacterized protein n=1 Tax=Candidatus Methanophaga sp. ANME-1 ERB7 TaxID=2759913 RepID=A0A7G9ZBE5_9EURY|nr:hypothetical protein MFOBGCIO_00007 [Methanosarcinales archaeon ANME-1 ERB7]
MKTKIVVGILIVLFALSLVPMSVSARKTIVNAIPTVEKGSLDYEVDVPPKLAATGNTSWWTDTFDIPTVGVNEHSKRELMEWRGSEQMETISGWHETKGDVWETAITVPEGPTSELVNQFNRTNTAGRNTTNFNITGETWRVEWNYSTSSNHSYFAYDLVDEEGLIMHSVTARNPKYEIRGVTYLKGTGEELYFRVDKANLDSWSIKVYQDV